MLCFTGPISFIISFSLPRLFVRIWFTESKSSQPDTVWPAQAMFWNGGSNELPTLAGRPARTQQDQLIISLTSWVRPPGLGQAVRAGFYSGAKQHNWGECLSAHSERHKQLRKWHLGQQAKSIPITVYWHHNTFSSGIVTDLCWISISSPSHQHIKTRRMLWHTGNSKVEQGGILHGVQVHQS